MLFFSFYLSMQSFNPKSARREAGILLDKLLVLLYLQPIGKCLTQSCTRRRRRMVALKRTMVSMVVFTMAVAVFASPGGAATTGILAPGAKWEEVSHVGLATSEGVVADRNGMVYVADISRAPVAKGYYPCGTIWRYDPRTGSIDKFMQAKRRGEWAALRPQRRYDHRSNRVVSSAQAEDHPAQHADGGNQCGRRFVPGQASGRGQRRHQRCRRKDLLHGRALPRQRVDGAS